MEKILYRFDFDFQDLPNVEQRYLQKEIVFFEKKLKSLIAPNKLEEIVNVLTGDGEYKKFIDDLIDLLLFCAFYKFDEVDYYFFNIQAKENE